MKKFNLKALKKKMKKLLLKSMILMLQLTINFLRCQGLIKNKSSKNFKQLKSNFKCRDCQKHGKTRSKSFKMTFTIMNINCHHILKNLNKSKMHTRKPGVKGKFKESWESKTITYGEGLYLNNNKSIISFKKPLKEILK